MITYKSGNLLESAAEALVNTVNTVGVMGKGIALQFKIDFPNNFKYYVKICKEKKLSIGEMLFFEDISTNLVHKKIINFPTKEDWRNKSTYEYIEKGLRALRKLILDKKIVSIAIPALGVGNGGLEWQQIKALIETYLMDLDCQIEVYEPNFSPVEKRPISSVSLTPARAMLLAMCYDLIANEEFVSEFAAEKLCYFMQRFGAADIFKLNFEPYTYGPYSGKVRHVLYHLNGAYLLGFADKNAKPFDELEVVLAKRAEVLAYLQNFPKEYEIVQRTQAFLLGWYSNFNLELLSTLDFIRQKYGELDLNEMQTKLSAWSNRKSQLFSKPDIVQKVLSKVQQLPS